MPKAAAAKSDSAYGVHPGVAMVQKWAAELKEKTGRSLEEWLALVKKEGPERAEGKGSEEDTPEGYLKAAVRYVEEQYAGPKEKLRPVYDELLRLGKSLGVDVKPCPCKTIVPLYRNHVFAQIKPTTNTRIDLGFALTHHKGKLPKRMIDTGGLAKKDRITHRIELSAVAEIDGEVKKWLKTAYDLDR